MNGARSARALAVACVAALVCLVTTASATAATIAAGAAQSCAITRAGNVFCWGANDSGQLGDGTVTARTGPVKVSGLTDVTALAAGGSHTCALLAGGTVSCWGANGNGQLGDGTTTQSSTPVSVNGITDAVQIAAGATHSCALLSDGSVECWGDNTAGRLGDGTTTQRLTPVPVSGLVKATALSVGNAHSCVVKDGGIRCWGLGTSGQLGDGTTNSSSAPVAVSGISGAQQVTAGGAHSCARVVGAVKCWGANSNGQLGDGTTSTPRLVPVTAGSLSGVTQLDAGGNHTCAADATPQVTCWGLNTSGQIGDNSTTQRTAPTVVLGIASVLALSAGTNHTCALDSLGVFRCWGAGASGQIGDDGGVQRPVPATVPRLAGGRAIAGGQAHTCTALSAGSFWCWGTNGAGQLGVGDSSMRPLPTRTYFADDAIAVAAGQTHTCAIVSGGQAKCWGSDTSGQLGDDATLASKNIPVNVSGISTAIRVATGQTHTCAIVSGGQAKCWGSDNNLQLGDDAVPSNKATPVDVSGLTNAIEISAGGTTSCAIVSGGQAKCWGNNVLGQIGNGNTTNQSAPTNVTGVTSAVAIASGLSHSCAIVSGGTVKCWGYNGYGQLGNNSTTNSSTAVTVSGVTGATAIEAGDNHTCVVVTLGAVKCWGLGSFGQLGDGLSTQSLVPVDVSGLLGVTAITAGQNHTCAIQAVGRETCWGYASGNQLGNGSTFNRSTPFEDELMLEPLIRFDSIGEGEFIQNPQPAIAFSTADVISPMIECNLDGGGWSICSSPFTPPAPLSLGRHSLQIRASGTDFVDGPISYSSLSFAVYTVLPSASITSPASGASSNDNTPPVTFDATGEGALTTTCRIDSGAFDPCVSPYTVPTIADGPHTITVKVVDANANAATASISLTIDTIAPNTSVSSGPPAMSTSANASFSFSSTETGTFECKLDAGAWGACVSPLAYSSLAEGAHGFQVRATDGAGNTDSTPASFGWNVDTIAPNTTITSMPPTQSNATSATFAFSSTESGSFECNLDGGGWTACSASTVYSSLAQGAHGFQARAIDPSGNVDATPAAYSWTVDTIAPTTTITGNPAAQSNSAAASFSFSSNEGGTFSCSLDGGAYTGCVSPIGYPSLAAGPHNFQVRATDLAGNIDATPAGFSWTIDLTPPNTSITSNPAAVSNSGAAAFSFSATEPATYECNLDGGGWGTCTSPLAYSALVDGAHTFQVRATDSSGNTDATPASYNWTADFTAPQTTITSSPAAVTTATTASFSFSSDETGSFECRIDGGGWNPCTSPRGYSLLPDGAHSFSVRAIDGAGNTDASPAGFSWTIDTVAPDTTIGTIAAFTSVTTASFTLGATETAAFACKLDGASYSSCTSPLALSGLSEGAHTVNVYAIDPAGNADPTPASRSWTVDSVAPAIAIGSPPLAFVATVPSVSFTVSDATTTTKQCRVDAGTYATCSSPFAPGALAEGAHTVYVRATDQAGNQTVQSAGFTLDSIAPAVQVTTPASGGTTGFSSPPVNFSVTDATATSTKCKIDGGLWVACSSPFTPPALAGGPHTIGVSATDQAGNGGTASVSFTVDSTYPTVAISSPAAGQVTADNTPTTSFSATGTALVSECKVDSGSFVACASGGPLPALADGAHTLTVRVTDSPLARVATDTVSFTVDTTAPVAAFNAPVDGAVSGQSMVNASYGVVDTTAVVVTCSIDAVPAGACSSPFSAGPLSDGPHQLALHVTDAAGNAADATVGVTVDTTAPVVTIAAPLPGATLATSPANSQFSAIDATPVAFACAVDGGTYVACASPFSLTLAAGSHNVAVRATDAAGNQGASNVTFTLAPPVTSPAPGPSPSPAPPAPVSSPAPPAAPVAVAYVPVVLAKQVKLKLRIVLLLMPPPGVTAVCGGKVTFGGKLKRTKLRALAALARVGSNCVATAKVKLKPGTRGKLKLTAAFAGSSHIAAVTTARAVKLK